MTQQFEFKIEERSYTTMSDAYINMLKSFGWILDDVTHTPKKDGGLFGTSTKEKYVYKFKRPVNYLEEKQKEEEERRKLIDFRFVRISLLVQKYFPEYVDDLITMKYPDKILWKIWHKISPNKEPQSQEYHLFINEIFSLLPKQITKGLK